MKNTPGLNLFLKHETALTSWSNFSRKCENHFESEVKNSKVQLFIVITSFLFWTIRVNNSNDFKTQSLWLNFVCSDLICLEKGKQATISRRLQKNKNSRWNTSNESILLLAMENFSQLDNLCWRKNVSQKTLK